MAKRRYPGFPKDFHFDYKMGEPAAKTYAYFSEKSHDATAGPSNYVVTFDGILQVIIHQKYAIIIDGGTKTKDIMKVFENHGAVTVANIQVHGPCSSEVVSFTPDDPLKKRPKLEVEQANLQRALSAEIRKVIGDATIKLCLVSHPHVAHLNILAEVLESKNIEAFILGGCPNAYLNMDEGKLFLSFISNHCKTQTMAAVYLTFIKENISGTFRDISYSALYFSPNYYKGHNIIGHPYVDYQKHVSSQSTDVIEFASLLKISDTVEIALNLFRIPCC